MLQQLIIHNFVIVDALTIEFHKGLSAITGETGAGKSIAIDALGICLGDRTDNSVIRNGAERADISALFMLDDIPNALHWLQENELDDGQECILRRVIKHDGRSKAYINGHMVPIVQLRAIGQLLVQLHSQHMHQQLLKTEYQRQLLDNYLHDAALINQMQQHYQKWQQAQKQLNALQQEYEVQQAQSQLLQYQLQELNDFSPQQGEYEQLDAEYKRLANCKEIVQRSQIVCQLLAEDDDVNAMSLINRAKQELNALVTLDSSLALSLSLLEEAVITLNELSQELRYYAEHAEADPERLYELEQRLDKQLTLARKHQIKPEALPEFYANLQQQAIHLAEQDDTLLQLQQQVNDYYQQAQLVANTLHQRRTQAAETLAVKIEQHIRAIAMPQAEFVINVQFNAQQLTAQGADLVEFNVRTNSGQPLARFSKVVSGGELSRIALAIQVITAQQMAVSTLIFDEVDVGISGATAAKVGQQLRQLGDVAQVLCVTHLPQVAGHAHHHYLVSKESNNEETTTNMILLETKARINELARLLGGDKITQHTLANAEELLII